jgi:transketolase
MPADFKPFDKQEWLRLEKKADELRRLTLKTSIWGGSGHLGGAMSCMDAMTISEYAPLKSSMNVILSQAEYLR